MRYPARVFERYGLDGLEYTPRVCVGTIHSTKGAEADRVYLLPDLSRASLEQFHTGDRDSIIRTFYVGITRAKQDLVLCGPSSRSALQWMI
jgi:superfamily I DNA/RNA helicase